MRTTVKDARFRVEEMLNNPASKHFFLVNGTIALFALASVLLVLATVFPYFERYGAVLFRVEWVTTVFFTFEYALRLSVAKRRWAYVQSPLGLIDLLSFIPTYVGLGNFAFLKAVRFIRIARLSRVANVTNVTKVLPKKE